MMKTISCRSPTKPLAARSVKNEKEITANALRSLIFEVETRIYRNEHPEVASSSTDKIEISDVGSSDQSDYSIKPAKPGIKLLPVRAAKPSKFISKVQNEVPSLKLSKAHDQQKTLINARNHHQQWQTTAERVANKTNKEPT
jgi:hypothetical protein